MPVYNASPGTISGVSTATSDPLQVVGSSGSGGQYGYNPDAQTYNPQQSAPEGSTLGLSTYSDGGGGGGGGAPAAPDPKIAQLAQAKSGVNGIVNSIFNVYNALYSDVGGAAADKANQVNQKYDTENKTLTDQFNSNFGQIGQGFAARGAYDSSYRINAEDQAQNAFGNAMAQQGNAKQSDLAGVGQFLAQSRGQIDAGKGSLGLVEQQIANATDVNEVVNLQNTLNAKLAELQGQQSGAQTQNYYLGQLNQQVPSTSALPQLQQSLANVMSSKVPPQVKRSIAEQLIAGATLSQPEKDQLSAQIAAQTTETPQV
jgi:hypothetical protein